MGYIPRPQTTESQLQQQQQSYMDQFNNAQYAAIPGYRGPQQPASAQPPPGTFNGQPINYNETTPRTGWGAGMGQLMGQIMPGLRSQWMNQNLSNADWQTFLPPNQGMQPGTAQNHMMQVAPPASMSGRYGQQAAALAGLLGNPGSGGASDGLLGGRSRGFRVPGGGK
jgi:hypothetical protein